MKLLLYCTKSKPYLIKYGNEYGYNQFDTSYCKDEHKSDYEYGDTILNGKIVAECDFEVEEIYFKDGTMQQAELGVTGWRTNKLTEYELLEKSCLGYTELVNYIKEDSGYAIHIKNLHIFDKPRELDYYEDEWVDALKKAPQNMRYCYDMISYDVTRKNILISIQPQWLCKILNKEKNVEVRRVVLKEML